MARRHKHELWTAGLAGALMAAAPSLAQTVPAPATNSATPAPAPAPAEEGLIGPPQLRDFNLNGTVTQRPAPVTTTPAPAPAPTPTVANPPTATSRAPGRTAPPVQSAPDTTTRQAAPDPGPGAPSEALPSPTPAQTADLAPGFGNTAPTTAQQAPLTPPVEVGSIWPWLLAALAAALGIGFAVRRQRLAGTGRYATAGIIELVATPPPAPTPTATPRQAAPAPLPRVQTPPQPPRPAAAPPARPAVSPPIPGGIVASGLKPKLSFELHPIRAQTEPTQGAALLFDVIVINNGSAPARDVLVETQLVNAGPQQDEEIGRFFREPVGTGERLPMIAPQGRVSIKTRLILSADQVRPIEMDGRRLFVPLVAINALYRWSGGEEQDSASFLVGRGGDDGGKMAPFRIDQGGRNWTGLSARPHSAGLQR
ncbi:MAG: hypothetical protein M3Q83_02900 [Pseudomonadota bacterium]|nr:hypothetical protein [Pseudomonadota bacterium]